MIFSVRISYKRDLYLIARKKIEAIHNFLSVKICYKLEVVTISGKQISMNMITILQDASFKPFELFGESYQTKPLRSAHSSMDMCCAFASMVQ